MVDLEISSDVIKNVGLMIFDKDGTLMALYNYWSNMVNYRASLAQEKLGFDYDVKKNIMYAMGVDLAKERLRKEGPVGLKKREIVMQAMVDALTKAGFNDTSELCFEIFKDVDSLSIKHFPEIIKPVNGMFQLIEGLFENSCKVAIATTDKTERARMAMEFLGISNRVDLVIGEDMVANGKPSPDMALLILGKLNVQKENAVMVGDASADVLMGRNAGLRASIGVTSGLTQKQDLFQITPHVVPDVSFIKILE